jgi:hypothetical protein
VAAADAGKHFLEDIEMRVTGGGVVVVHILGEHLALGGGMSAVGSKYSG